MRELFFSVTAKDCEWNYTKGTGAGGQKRNKTSSAVHCLHPPSGARGYSESSRSQHDNKQDAFLKMTQTKEFKDWIHMEGLKMSGRLAQIESEVERQMQPSKLKIEVKEDGAWKDEQALCRMCSIP